VRAQDVSNDLVLRYVRKREAESVEGSTIGRELNILRCCFKLGMRGNPPKMRTMPYFPSFADKKREGFMDGGFHDAFAEACGTVRRRLARGRVRSGLHLRMAPRRSSEAGGFAGAFHRRARGG
jgi:hypothetical protein